RAFTCRACRAWNGSVPQRGLEVARPWRHPAVGVAPRQPTGRVLAIDVGRRRGGRRPTRRSPDIELTVTDTDPDMVTAARRTVASFGDRLLVRQADALNLPFGDGTFDAKAFFLVLHHVRRRREC
ncbi:MAG TPA: class I SAM-dependent methyltransferase, partial [Streptosporangiaceae bacterium]